MCDQDHLDETEEYEKRGLVTRRQFGVLLGAGVSMMLPQVANAVAVTEQDVTITTPTARRTRISSIRQRAQRPASSPRRTFSGCALHSGRRASGLPSRATRC